MKGLAIIMSIAAVCVFAQDADADEAARSVNFAQPRGVTAPSDATPHTASTPAEPETAVKGGVEGPQATVSQEYRIGNEDILDIAVLQPEQLALTVTVSPDGSITFPYIGKVDVKGKTPSEVQDEIQSRLADGYLKYPVVSVAVKESRSKKFYVYGEVLKPGTYFLEDNMTVLKAISTAGGFTKYGSSSRVKVLRPKVNGSGYETFKANMKLIMNGLSKDIVLEPGDIVQVEEGVF
ncbi:MAG: polysaccharide export protein [Candidatus Omnitrophica bacterium]|nr:polysaccharide export protein [Candidatus Omnitrophota bacterium]